MKTIYGGAASTTAAPAVERESMSDFQQFMRGLAADVRLGRLFPGDLATQSPEVIVLSLAGRLAEATEGRLPHPAHELLDRMETAR